MDKEQMHEENAQFARKEKFKKQYEGVDLMGLILAMKKVQDRKDKGEEVMKDINVEYDLLRIDLIPKAMEDQGLENVTVQKIGRVSLTGDMYVQTIDPAELFKFLRKIKMGDLIKDTVNSSTLKAWLKGRIKEGKPIPDAKIVKVTSFTRASITKVSK